MILIVTCVNCKPDLSNCGDKGCGYGYDYPIPANQLTYPPESTTKARGIIPKVEEESDGYQPLDLDVRFIDKWRISQENAFFDIEQL